MIIKHEKITLKSKYPFVSESKQLIQKIYVVNFFLENLINNNNELECENIILMKGTVQCIHVKSNDPTFKKLNEILYSILSENDLLICVTEKRNGIKAEKIRFHKG